MRRPVRWRVASGWGLRLRVDGVVGNEGGKPCSMPCWVVGGFLVWLCGGWLCGGAGSAVARADAALPPELPATTVTGAAVDPEPAAVCRVFCFLGVECPVARLYASRLEELVTRYRDRGVQFIGVNSNPHDSAEEVATAAAELGLTFPFVKDASQQVARRLAATRTAEVVVVDAAGHVAYRGRIDDQYAPGVTRPTPTRHDLAEALDAVLAGRPVASAETTPVGCLITFVDAPVEPAADAPTFTAAVAPVLFQHCGECHRPGDIGPFDISDYAEVRGWGEMMVEVMEQGRMPPWHASPEHGEFKNVRTLPAGTIELVRRWLDAGMPFGDAAEMPALPPAVAGWRLPREPDVVVAMDRDGFRVPASGTVEYQYYVADPGLEEDLWVSAAQVVPGATDVVHHAIAFARPPDDAAFTSLGLITAYVPGQRATILPPGHARRVPAGSKIVYQMHYTPSGTERVDLSQLGLVGMPAADVTHEVLTIAAMEQDFVIPPHASSYPVEAVTSRWPAGATLLAISPHMHLRGRAFQVIAVRATGEELLLDVPRYDFNWQHTYELTDPLPLDDVEALKIVAVFDNSTENPANPAPAEDVMWGDQTYEEMALAFFEVSRPLAAADSGGRGTTAGGRDEMAGGSTGAVELRAATYADGFLARFDRNHDGVVTKAEASAVVRMLSFSILDRDGDGRITRSELVAAVQDRLGR
jgi:peroxiredoxin